MEENVKGLNIKTQVWSFQKAKRTKGIKNTHFYYLYDPRLLFDEYQKKKKLAGFNHYVDMGHFLQLRISITLQNWA